MFVNLAPASKNSMVATIGGEVNLPQGHGTVNWSWKDDDGITHLFLIQNVYFFPQSPINILGIDTFAQ